jgi:hypothetical protein
MLEGCDVRISGQDVGRGTFSQRYDARTGLCGVLTLALLRHAMFVDQKTESVVVPLNTALGPQGKLELANSMWTLNWFNAILNRTHAGSLSELAVLGVSCDFGRICQSPIYL